MRDLARRRAQCRGRTGAAAALGDLEERVSRPLVIIAGMMGNKDANAFLANFAGLTRHIIAVQIPDHDNAMPPDTLADAARHLGMRVETSAGVEAALRSLTRLAYEVPPRILITGSLYLAGHVLAINGTPPDNTMRFAAIADVHGNYLALEA